MTSPSRRDVERRLSDLEGDGEGGERQGADIGKCDYADLDLGEKWRLGLASDGELTAAFRGVGGPNDIDPRKAYLELRGRKEHFYD